MGDDLSPSLEVGVPCFGEDVLGGAAGESSERPGECAKELWIGLGGGCDVHGRGEICCNEKDVGGEALDASVHSRRRCTGVLREYLIVGEIVGRVLNENERPP